MSKLHGVLSALVTPFTADGESVDEGALRALVKLAVGGGVHGLVSCGSTGEFAALTNEERRSVLEIVIDETAGRRPVVAHTGAMTTREAIGLSRHAEQAGADAVMVVAPYYEPLTTDEVGHYYRDVASSVSIDVMIYNLPAATGVNLGPDYVAKLAADVPNISYVKDTTGDLGQAARLIHDHGDVISTFVGEDTLYLAALVEGAAGSVLGAANMVPSQLVSVHEAVQDRNLDRARSIWEELFPLMELLTSGGYVSAVKAGLGLLGLPVGDPRAPMAPLSGARLAALKALLEDSRTFPSLS